MKTILFILSSVTITLGQLSSYQDGPDLLALQSDNAQQSDDASINMLTMAIPGTPGQDYPILAEVPESAFTCDNRVEGGYYADVEAQCQPFHICANDGNGLAKFSFLCPNGTLFNQEYFICDWWFNVDCSNSENLFSLNDDIAAERSNLQSEASNQQTYTAPLTNYGASPNTPNEVITQGKAIVSKIPSIPPNLAKYNGEDQFKASKNGPVPKANSKPSTYKAAPVKPFEPKAPLAVQNQEEPTKGYGAPRDESKAVQSPPSNTYGAPSETGLDKNYQSQSQYNSPQGNQYEENYDNADYDDSGTSQPSTNYGSPAAPIANYDTNYDDSGNINGPSNSYSAPSTKQSQSGLTGKSNSNKVQQNTKALITKSAKNQEQKQTSKQLPQQQKNTNNRLPVAESVSVSTSYGIPKAEPISTSYGIPKAEPISTNYGIHKAEPISPQAPVYEAPQPTYQEAAPVLAIADEYNAPASEEPQGSYSVLPPSGQYQAPTQSVYGIPEQPSYQEAAPVLAIAEEYNAPASEEPQDLPRSTSTKQSQSGLTGKSNSNNEEAKEQPNEYDDEQEPISTNYGTPKAEPISSNYGSPQSEPINSYGAPKEEEFNKNYQPFNEDPLEQNNQYNPPQTPENDNIINEEGAVENAEFNDYNDINQSSNYNSPQTNGQLVQNIAPTSNYGVPQKSDPLRDSYESPTTGYGAPQSEYNAPELSQNAVPAIIEPNTSYGSPSADPLGSSYYAPRDEPVSSDYKNPKSENVFLSADPLGSSYGAPKAEPLNYSGPSSTTGTASNSPGTNSYQQDLPLSKNPWIPINTGSNGNYRSKTQVKVDDTFSAPSQSSYSAPLDTSYGAPKAEPLSTYKNQEAPSLEYGAPAAPVLGPSSYASPLPPPPPPPPPRRPKSSIIEPKRPLNYRNNRAGRNGFRG